jgi:hypothetical protein
MPPGFDEGPPKSEFAPDSPLEGGGFEVVWGFLCQVGLRVADEPADVLLGDPPTRQKRDHLALIRSRDKFLPPGATGYARHFDTFFEKKSFDSVFVQPRQLPTYHRGLISQISCQYQET